MRVIALFQALLFLALGLLEGTPLHHCPHHDGMMAMAMAHAHPEGAARGMGGAMGARDAAPAPDGAAAPTHHDDSPTHRGCTCLGCCCCCQGLIASYAPPVLSAPLAATTPLLATAWTSAPLRANYLDLLPDSTAPPRAVV